MKILVWGLGYVGTVSAACLARLGHEVVGVEPSGTKVDSLNAGRSSVKEPGIDEMVETAVRDGSLRAVQSGGSLVGWADLSLVCVGTPTDADGGASLEYVRNVAKDIGEGLRDASQYHVVVLRSTVPPGTIRGVLAPLLEELSGRRAGRDFGLASNPEFMRETTAIADFHAPPYTIIGAWDERSGERVASAYAGISAPVHQVAIEEAELLKLVNNAFHALKVGFANEIGRVCSGLHLDSHTVMGLVCQDTKLNISPRYLRPGFAFGGSCLPKDVRALAFQGRRLGVTLPIIDAILPSNRLQIETARARVLALRARRLAVLGIGFKPGTDDLRESPTIELVRSLWQDGLDILIFDPDVQLATMLGSNREYLERQLPQIHQILCSRLEDALHGAEAVIVSQNRVEFVEALRGLDDRVAVLELVRSTGSLNAEHTRVRGLSWTQQTLGVG
jgi:GDP-mannose 6-dehydrogenase